MFINIVIINHSLVKLIHLCKRKRNFFKNDFIQLSYCY